MKPTTASSKTETRPRAGFFIPGPEISNIPLALM
ncbi:hypothetical protein P3T25_005146 [Paraburkholderia sp. GAS32]